WLVDKYAPALEHSREQIGVPEAERAGYSGRGVAVAVLDTGIDAEHPDFAGVITQAQDFTKSPVGVKDEVGHGTHVASIIAGRGTASGGKNVGIARDANLVIGKVCGKSGCPLDAILAGMEWATTTPARVANLSLGGVTSGEDDLLTRAVDQLTAVSRVLFVVA